MLMGGQRVERRKRALCEAKLGYIAQLTFTHHTLMWFVDAFHTILKLPAMLWQVLSNDVRSSRNCKGRGNKHSLTDVKLMDCHRTLCRNDYWWCTVSLSFA